MLNTLKVLKMKDILTINLFSSTHYKAQSSLIRDIPKTSKGLFGFIYLSLPIGISTCESLWESLWKHIMTHS